MNTDEIRAALGKTDERGKGILAPISPFTWVGVAITAGVKGRVVPSEFWVQDVTDDGEEVAIVSCPCGHAPQVPPLELVECNCQRTYFNGLKEVWSLNVPTAQETSTNAERRTLEEDGGDIEAPEDEL